MRPPKSASKDKQGIVLGLQRDYVAAMRRQAAPYTIMHADQELVILPGAFPPYLDSDLIVRHLHVAPHEVVLDVGSGSGVIALAAARQAQRVVATDISPAAVATVRANAERQGLADRIAAFQADLFPSREQGPFDVITFNPPYSDHPAADVAERSVWDPDHATVRRFFAELTAWLVPDGRLYLGWADFADFGFIEGLMAAQGGCFRRIGEARDEVSLFAVYEVRLTDR